MCGRSLRRRSFLQNQSAVIDNIVAIGWNTGVSLARQFVEIVLE
jgi:hypothetical protein